jgi:putative transposase
MSRIKPETGYYYHIYNRGVDRRIIFEDSSDYARFIHSLYFCNDARVKNLNIYRSPLDVKSPTLHIQRSENRLVNILCFSLMPNHYHLLIEQVADDGISSFMHRLGTAYTNYFNIKKERSGSLFQGKYKIKQIIDEKYLIYLSKYIHLNPLEIIEPDWQESGIKDRKAADDFLNNYKWSSYPDYIGEKNFSSVIHKDLLNNYYPGPENYKIFINNFIPGEFNKVEEKM